MEIVGNETVEFRRGGKTVEAQAELAGFEPSTLEYDKEKEKVKYRWQRFLSRRALRILVVEVDDCTRQVVSALLRNCCYQVTAVADGLQAWELLEDPSNHFDIVLTEVVMPSISGFGLLRKIMSHKTLKNIPVISNTYLRKLVSIFLLNEGNGSMRYLRKNVCNNGLFFLFCVVMSSLDSIGIVFKCLSKGAVDFLVKPVRKNELQNIWQHVWRRYHSMAVIVEAQIKMLHTPRVKLSLVTKLFVLVEMNT